MIEINLLPGVGKNSRSRGTSVNLGAVFSGVLSRVKDPYLLSAIASASAAVLVIGGLYTRQVAHASSLADAEQRAVQDSTRYAAVLREKRHAESQRDSVIRQLDIIRSIDNNRYVWPHIMDEMSRALPPYTWLTSVVQTSVAPSAATQPPKKDDKAKPDSADATDVTKFRVIGNTVDIQALTRFMKLLEASPFIQNVQLARSNLVLVDGKEATEFQLDAEYQKPDSAAIRTVPVSLSVR